MFRENFEGQTNSIYPYLEKDMAKFTGVLTRKPDRSEIPIEIDDHLVVEFYSKAM